MLVVAFLSGGAAYAYFTAVGTGSGAASATTLQTVTVAALVGGDAPTSSLVPGGPAADVVLRVQNPNAFSVTAVAVAATGAITADGAHPGCTTTGVSFTPPGSLAVTIPAGTSLLHVVGAATMSTASVSACQGATFSIPVSLTVHR